MKKLKYKQLYELFLNSDEWKFRDENNTYYFTGNSELFGVLSFKKDSHICAFIVKRTRYSSETNYESGFYRYWWNRITKKDEWFNGVFANDYNIRNIMKD